MKKILAFIICILVFAELCACVKEKSPEVEQSKAATALVLNNSNGENDGDVSSHSHNTKALANQAFVAVLNGEATVCYSVSNASDASDVYLKNIIYNLTTVTHASVDMDGDGIDEMVLRCGSTKILLKYHILPKQLISYQRKT